MKKESRVDSSEIAKLQCAKKTALVELELVPAIGRKVAGVDIHVTVIDLWRSPAPGRYSCYKIGESRY